MQEREEGGEKVGGGGERSCPCDYTLQLLMTGHLTQLVQQLACGWEQGESRGWEGEGEGEEERL